MMTLMKPVADLRWLYLDVNSYFASVEQQLEPSLRDRPVAVVPVMAERTCAIAASYEAKAYGVTTGMPIWEVKKRCPDIRIVSARHDLYVRFHHQILEEIETHLPVTKVYSIDEVACALIGAERSRENALTLGRKIKRGIIEKVGAYLRCSVGVAPTRLLAKLACKLQRPDGLTAIEIHELPEKILSLRLSALPGIGANMERRLYRAGVDDIAGLWTMNPKRARKIWHSVAGERFWYALHGIDLPEQETARRSIGHSRVLGPSYRQPGQARLVARRLTMKAASRLRRLDYLTAGIGLQVRLEDNSRWDGALRLQRTQDSLALLRGIEELWRQLVARYRGMSIKGVSVTLDRLMPLADAPADLFDASRNGSGEPRDRGTKLSHAMDRINKRYGQNTITLGMTPRAGLEFLGTKVAFTRIPDRAEFYE
jgi:DNA polymerase-4